MTILCGSVDWEEEGHRDHDVGADDGGAVGDGDGWEDEGQQDDVGAATAALPYVLHLINSPRKSQPYLTLSTL